MGHIVADPSDLRLPPAVAAVASGAGAGGSAVGGAPGLAHAVLFVTVPPAARPIDGAAMATMVALAVRDTAAAAPVPVGMASPVEAPPADDVGDAVVAAHDARIAVLRERLAALRGAAAATRAIDDLDARLHRAEAARRLAAARIGGDRIATALPVDPVPAPKPPTRIAAPSPKFRVAIARSSAARYAIRSATQRFARHPAWRHDVALAAVPRHSVAASTGATPAPSLSSARRSLAIARAALAVPPRTPRIALAGLWRWDGSDRWSLRADRGYRPI